MRYRTALGCGVICLGVALALTACAGPLTPTSAPRTISSPIPSAPGSSPPTALPAQIEIVSGPIESAASDASTPITVKLALSHPPRLDETVYLTFTISSVLDAPGTTAQIILPDGAEVVDGQLQWSGDLAAKQPHVMVAAVKFAAEGNQMIEGKALRPTGNGDVWGDAAQIYLHVTAAAGFEGYATEAPSPGDQTGEQEKPTPPAASPAPQ